jgi:hypothetical protein
LSWSGPYRRRGWRCFGGSQWLTASGNIAEVILQHTKGESWLLEHLRNCQSPEESFFQTVLCNSPGLRISNNNNRFILWPDPFACHPKTLGDEDFADIVNSGAHFARKFDQDSPTLDRLDKIVGLSKSSKE